MLLPVEQFLLFDLRGGQKLQVAGHPMSIPIDGLIQTDRWESTNNARGEEQEEGLFEWQTCKSSKLLLEITSRAICKEV